MCISGWRTHIFFMERKKHLPFEKSARFQDLRECSRIDTARIPRETSISSRNPWTKRWLEGWRQRRYATATIANTQRCTGMCLGAPEQQQNLPDAGRPFGAHPITWTFAFECHVFLFSDRGRLFRRLSPARPFLIGTLRQRLQGVRPILAVA